jgi:hypothetical protein
MSKVILCFSPCNCRSDPTPLFNISFEKKFHLSQSTPIFVQQQRTFAKQQQTVEYLEMSPDVVSEVCNAVQSLLDYDYEIYQVLTG